MAPLHSLRLYITLRLLYFTPPDSTLLYHGYTSLYLTQHYSTSGGFKGGCKCTPLWWLVMYFCVHNCTSPFKWLYSSGMQQQQPGTVTHSSISYLSPDVWIGLEFLPDIQFGGLRDRKWAWHPKIFRCASRGSGWTPLSKFLNPQLSTMALLHSSWLYITLTWLYLTLLKSTLVYHGSASLYFTLHYSTIALLHSTWLCIIQPWLYFMLLESTLLYHVPTWLYLTLHYSTTALLDSTWLYITLTRLYFTLCNSTLIYHASTSLCLSLHYSTMALLHSTWLHITLI